MTFRFIREQGVIPVTVRIDGPIGVRFSRSIQVRPRPPSTSSGSSDYGTTREILLRLITGDVTPLRDQRVNAIIQRPEPNATNKLQVFNLVLVMLGTTFEKPGGYEFVVEINTRHLASIPFEVVQVQMPKPT